MRVAFFDLDRTLVHGNSARLWVRHEWRRGALRNRIFLKGLAYLAAYRMGYADVEDALRLGITTLAGQRESELSALAVSFYAREVKPLLRRDARSAIARHRAAGNKLVLLTSSSPYLSSAVTSDLGLDDFLCTRFEVDGAGCFTGRALEPVCFGGGKVRLATSYVEKQGVHLADCAFYSDSFSDLPMLEAVGEPVVVTPDPRLRRHARARGWPIVTWT
ncbi:MAG: HAD family hydrolase [Myxococcota bacterium]|nr:HAD family hydrolase [Myxococcota bacterium]